MFSCVLGSQSPGGTSCTTSTPGITVKNGASIARWHEMLIDVS